MKLECTMYLSGELNHEIQSVLNEVLENPKDARGMYDVGFAELELRSNDIWKEGDFARTRSNFLFSGWVLEIDPFEGAEESQFLDLVSTLLRAFWAKDIMAVAACDYEHRLPWSGGSDRLDP